MKKAVSVAVLAGVVAWGTSSMADMAQMKVYKEAFPGVKVKCVDCHTAAVPKKDGDHGLNAYGEAVKKQADKDRAPVAATYIKVGSIEDFAKKM